MAKTPKRLELILLAFILLLGAFLRLYKIDQYMTFLGDEGRDVTTVREMLLGRKLTLLGPGTSIGSMYLGPLYYYLMVPALLLANFSPVGPAVQIAVLGLITIVLVWWVCRQWFDSCSALISALLYSISPTVIIYSRSSWNPNIMPFFTLLTMYGLWQVWRFKRWSWLIITAISLAFVLNSHYLGLLLIPVIGLFWFLTKKNWRFTLISVGIFVLLMSPLFFFDLRHGWINVHAITHFFSDRQATVNLKAYKAIPNLWPILVNVISSLVTAKQILIAQIAAVITLLGTMYLLIFRRSRSLLFLLTWIGAGLVGLGLYKQHIYDHYYGFLFPAILMLVGYILSLLPKKIIILPIVFLVYINLSHTPLLSSPNLQIARTTEIASFINSQTSGKPFNLALLSGNNYDAGYRYFLSLQKAPFYTIHEKLSDQLFVICELSDCKPIGNPLWEVAAFGWAKIDQEWTFPWGVRVYRLIHNPSGT